MNLLLLAPELQARVASGELVLTERVLRQVVGKPDWEEQLAIVLQITKEVPPRPAPRTT